MTARRRTGGGFHRFIEAVRRFVEAIRHAKNGGQTTGGRSAGGGGRNPWPKCPACFHRVPALCQDAEEGAEPCGNGLACGCCSGPHLAPKGAKSGGQGTEGSGDSGKFQTSAERA